MLLYDKNKNSIDIYTYNYSEEEMISFKKEKMKNISEDERILSAINSSLIHDKSRFINLKLPINKTRKKEFCLINSKLNNLSEKQILNLYYCGMYDNFNYMSIEHLKKIKYLLFDLESLKNKTNKDVFGNIIQVPEELYDIQLLLNSNFKMLKDKEIDEILELFTLNKIDEVDINNVYGRHSIIRKGNLEEAIKKAKNDKILLKKITRK